jgi:hypothetical protein
MLDTRSNKLYEADNQKELAAARADIYKKTQEFLSESQGSAETDIFSSLLLAQRVFETYSQKPVLVVFSDMIEVSDQANFMRGIPNISEIPTLVQKGGGAKANLHNAKIFVVGASAGNGQVTQKEYMKLQDFWIHYFGTVNGRLTEEKFGVPLITF